MNAVSRYEVRIPDGDTHIEHAADIHEAAAAVNRYYRTHGRRSNLSRLHVRPEGATSWALMVCRPRSGAYESVATFRD